MQTLSTSVKTTRVSNAVAAGVTTINSAIIDTLGFDSTRFEVLVGAINATGSVGITVQQGNVSDLSDAQNLAGAVSLNDTDDNKVAILEVLRTSRRYLRVQVTRGTANSVIDGIIALQYGARNLPTTDDATTTKARSIVANPIVDT